MFTEAEAARLLRVPQSTLHYWLEGGVRRGKSYQPILRLEPTGTRTISWAEFVEAALLRGYRKHLTAATRNCPEAVMELPAGGHESCPLAVMGSARHDVVCLAASRG
jgi:hypothetical protein